MRPKNSALVKFKMVAVAIRKVTVRGITARFCFLKTAAQITVEKLSLKAWTIKEQRSFCGIVK